MKPRPHLLLQATIASFLSNVESYIFNFTLIVFNLIEVHANRRTYLLIRNVDQPFKPINEAFYYQILSKITNIVFEVNVLYDTSTLVHHYPETI